MQPQNNNPSVKPVRPVGMTGAAGAARPVRPVGSARPVRRPVATGGVSGANVAPMPAAEPEPTFDNGPSVVGKKERKTGWILAIILLLLIAAGGVGFGVWMWMDGNAQKEALNNQISDLQQTNNNLMAQLDNANSTVSVDADGNEVNTADYIYVGEWGLKIKIPEDLVSVNYAVGFEDGTQMVKIAGVSKPDGSGWVLPDFADISKNVSGLGMVARYPKGAEMPATSGPQLIFSDDEYDYYYYHRQIAYSVDINDESNLDWETKTIDVITEMLTSAENYSSI